MVELRKLKTMVFIFVIIIVITPILYVQINKQIYKERVLTYLMGEKDYTQADIRKIEGHWGKLPTFYTTVIFENEPRITYLYYAHSEVHQAEVEIDSRSVDFLAVKREGLLLNIE